MILLCVLTVLLGGKSASPSLAVAIDFVTFSAGSKGTLKVQVIVVKEERMPKGEKAANEDAVG